MMCVFARHASSWGSSFLVMGGCQIPFFVTTFNLVRLVLVCSICCSPNWLLQGSLGSPRPGVPLWAEVGERSDLA